MHCVHATYIEYVLLNMGDINQMGLLQQKQVCSH